MGMQISNVMDGLGSRLRTISGLNVYDFPPDGFSIPCAVVGYPEPLTYDSTMARGCDTALIPVWIVTGRVSDESSRDELAAYMDGSGSKSVKVAIENDPSLGGASQTLRVTESTADTVTGQGIEYLAARFTVEVIA